jgi:hypothetical protein
MREREIRFRATIPAVVLLTFGGLFAAFSVASVPGPLRDRHAQSSLAAVQGSQSGQWPRRASAVPAVSAVVVTPAGKLFHDSRCPFIHGSPVVEDVASAVAQGYSPCPRCLGTLRNASLSASSSYSHW